MNWYELADSSKIISPALLVYPERVEKNVVHMLHMAKQPKRLRPHIKTHKMMEIIELQLAMDIYKFKCATLAEAELLARAGAKDVLLAMQPVSAQLAKFIDIINAYPGTVFSTLVDSQETLINFKEAAKDHEMKLALWLDVNNGMNRTGIAPGKEAKNLCRSIADEPLLDFKGLHVYDGHNHQEDPAERAIACERDFQAVNQLIADLESEGFKVPKIIAGGTPTFPIHAGNNELELSPGTTVLWDAGYAGKFNDLNFLTAAVLLTRIISKPAKNILCFDLGHKSVASEMSFPRVQFLGDHNFEQISQSEEHLVVKCQNSDLYHLGDPFYAVPIHICPTVPKYAEALTVVDHKITGSWIVAARDHILN